MRWPRLWLCAAAACALSVAAPGAPLAQTAKARTPGAQNIASDAPPPVQDLTQAPRMGPWGFDAAGEDPSAKAGDDFFRFANGKAIDKLVKGAARAARRPVDIHFVADKRVYVGAAPSPKGGGEVWLVRFDPHAQEVAIKAGDNKGQLLVERNVVRELVRLGAWRGQPKTYRLPSASEEGLRTVVLVQAARGGRLLGTGIPKA